MACLVACLVVGGFAAGAEDDPRLRISRIDRAPTLEEYAGTSSPPVSNGLVRVPAFVQREPVDGAPPSFPTDVYIGYDDEALHVVFVATDDEPDKIRANLAQRDNVFDDDSVNIVIDTDNDQRRGYAFIATPRGVQWEGQYTEGGGFDSSFDAVWQAEGRVTDRGFVVRMEIPFVSLRFPDTDEQTWRVIFNRSIPRLSEDSYWPGYTRAIEGRLNQAALLTGIRDISPGRNIQIAPFVFYRDFRNELGQPAAPDVVEEGDEEAIGVDAKFVLRDALVLDLTANPDFSQVESDEPQVTVNERFEVFFPERRPFFLENADVFDTPTNLVFTRRIRDPSGGIKLTGKQGRYKLGLLLADDEAPGKDRLPGDPLADESARIGVLRISRDVSSQSTLGLLYTKRDLDDGHNHVGAVDGRIKWSANWTTDFQAASSSTRPVGGGAGLDGMAYTLNLNSSGTHLGTHTHWVYTSHDFVTELGFLGERMRPGVQNVHHDTSYRFRPEGSALTEWGPSIYVQRLMDTDGGSLGWEISPAFEWRWAGGTGVELDYEATRERLLPVHFAALTAPLELGESILSAEFETERFERVGFSVELEAGRAINFVPPPGQPPEEADLLATGAEVLWRPMSPLRLDFTYLRTQIDRRSGSGRVFTNTIGRVRANWQFTRELSLRLIAEYEDTDAVAAATRLTDESRFTGDILLRYVWNPWRALYVGYTTDALDYDGSPNQPPGSLPVELTNRGHQVFVKFSHLFQL